MNLLDFLSEENRQKNTRWLDDKSRQFHKFLNRALPRNPNDKGHAIQPLMGLMEAISPATDVVDAQSSSQGLMNELARGSKINAFGQGARMLASLGSVALPGNLVRTYDELTSSQQQAQEVIDSLKSGKADQVTDEMLANADQEYLSKNYDLPMDTESRMARAKEMGLDTDTKQFHGTSSDEFPSFEKDRIGSASDEGFYGKGFYFVPYKGEASYYGKNVGEYFLPKSKDILNLSNETNDFTFYPIEYFKQWNQKFEDLGVLDETQKKSFQAVKKLDNYVNKNVKYLPLRHSDGTEGIIAKVDFPNKYDPEYPREITSTLSAYDSRNMPKTEEDALSDLKRQVIHETSFNSELKKQFEGIGDTTWSISDYIRSDWKIPEKLSEKVAEKGYKGINVGDETVIFEPENIRKTDARFDPRLKHLKNLSAGIPLGLLPFLMGNKEDQY